MSGALLLQKYHAMFELNSLIHECKLLRENLQQLLTDKTTRKNILFATGSYENLGLDYAANMPITINLLNAMNLKPRTLKSQEEQILRTRKKAEVFSPAWLCCKMNNYCDMLFYDTRKNWQKYVDSRWLEITCGEAPYIVSRYDAASGEEIILENRVGILDRKLRIVNENSHDSETWLKWTLRAFQSVYGYEWQGDNLLLARVNLFMTFIEYYNARWGNTYDKIFRKTLRAITNAIAWNFWQMDGLTATVPRGALEDAYCEGRQLTFLNVTQNKECKIFNWRANRSLEYNTCKGVTHTMKFDFCIGNPPYQDDTVGEQKAFAPPVYDKFMNAAYEISDRVMLITPARFLFNAGATAKAWNEKMLNDEHLKVLEYEQDSSKLFRNTDIKGGVAITYRDTSKNFGAIGIYTAYPELNSILSKVKNSVGFSSFSAIVMNRGLYRFSKKAYTEYPDETAKISDSRVGANAFDRLSPIFHDEKPDDRHEYIQILGREKNQRVKKYIRRDYVNDVPNLYKWKVFLAKANGSGAIGEVLSTPLIGQPLIGHTETFMTIGSFDTEEEAKACYKYICSKFCRVMLGVLKITQDNPPEKWQFVPLQNFAPESDIDWSATIAEIDQQLYRKYGLSDEEINFIETHVKEMS